MKFIKILYSNNQRMCLCPFLFQAFNKKCLGLVSILLNSSQTDLKAYISGKSQILSPLLALRFFLLLVNSLVEEQDLHLISLHQIYVFHLYVGCTVTTEMFFQTIKKVPQKCCLYVTSYLQALARHTVPISWGETVIRREIIEPLQSAVSAAVADVLVLCPSYLSLPEQRWSAAC